jgi:hypothetical protein
MSATTLRLTPCDSISSESDRNTWSATWESGERMPEAVESWAIGTVV